MAEGDGAATDTGTLGEPVQTTAPTPPPPPATISLSQVDLDARMVARAEQAKRNERQAILESLGFKSLKEAEEFAKGARDAELASMTEAQRAKAEADAERNEAAAERKKLAEDRHALNVERALANAKAEGDIADLALLVRVDQGAAPEEIATAVDSVKAKYPSLFGAATAAPAPSEPTGGGAPSRPSSAPDALARGQARAEQYNTQGGRIPS